MLLPIGNTPLLKIHHPTATILAKWEGANLTGSAKDRAAAAMLKAAKLPANSTIVEATSGNTGISLASLAAKSGHRCVIVMPENMSRERIQRMRVYGAEVILTPAAEGMAGAVQKAKEISGKKTFYVNQFENPANPEAHFSSTGPEIWQQAGGKIDIFLAGIGTGGTISGTGRFLKSQDPHIRIFGVTPAPDSTIPGLGAGFVPKILDRSLLDGYIPITAEDAHIAARNLAHNYGLLAGISSGAAFHAAQTLADLPGNQGKTIVTIFPDTGCRYLSEW